MPISLAQKSGTKELEHKKIGKMEIYIEKINKK